MNERIADPCAPTRTNAPRNDKDASSSRLDAVDDQVTDDPASVTHPPSETPAASNVSRTRLPAPLQYRDPERYQVIAEHGRGGLGRVMRARDRELGRSVAIKELLHHTATSELRFFREALITARLEHPAIVPVHEAGRWPDGTPFYAMKLVAGSSLSEVIDQSKTLEQRLALLPRLIAVADAVAYAHARSIIHRDIKPSNIIVGDYGETVLIDWGLAKDLKSEQEPTLAATPQRAVHSATSHASKQEAAQLTSAGSVLGTAAYMPPEQARGDDAVDFRADIYALGAALFHVLTGHPPPDSLQPSADAAIRTSFHTTSVPPELQTVIRKAMAHDPADRYHSIKDFADDLRAYQGGLRVQAHSYSRSLLLRRWITKYRLPVTIAVIAFGAVLATTAVNFIAVLKERDQARHAELQAQERADELALSRAEALLATDPTRAQQLASKFVSSDRAARIMSQALNRGVASQTISPKVGNIRTVLWQSSDTLLIQGDNTLLPWNVNSDSGGPPIQIASISYVDIDATRQRLVFQGSDSVVFRNLATGQDTRLATAEGTPWDLKISMDGARVAFAHSTGRVTVWSIGDGAAFDFSRPPGVYQALRFSHDGRLLASCGRDGTLVVWSTDNHKVILDGKCDGLPNVDYRFLPDDSGLVIGWRNGQLDLWRFTQTNGQTRARRATIARSSLSDRIIDIIGTRNGTFIAGTESGEIVAYDMERDAQLWRVHVGHRLTRLADGRDLNVVFAGRIDGAVTVISTKGQLVGQLLGHASPISALELSPEGKWLATCSPDHTVRLWPMPLITSHSVRLAASPLITVKFSPDGRLVASEGQDGSVSTCETPTLKCETEIAHRSLASGIAWTSDGSRLASTGWDGLVRVWARTTKQSEYHRLLPEGGAAYIAGYLGGDQFALFYLAGRGIEIRRMADLEAGPVLRFNPGIDVVMSQSGNRLASVGSDGILAVWEATPTALQPLARFHFGAPGRVVVASLSATGRYGAVMSSNRKLTYVGISRVGIAPLKSVEATSDDPIWNVSFTNDERHSVVRYSSGQIALISLEDGTRAVYRPFTKPPTALVTQSSRIAAITDGGLLWALDLRTHAQCVTQVEHVMILNAALSPDGRLFAASSESGHLHVLDLNACHWIATAASTKLSQESP